MTENIYLFFLTRAGTHTCRGCKMQDLVKCESKIQVVIPLGKGVLTHRTWYFLLQLEKVFELRGITTSFVFIFFSWRLRDIHFPHLKNTKPKIAHKYLIFSWYLNGVYACRSWRQSDVPIVRHINNNNKKWSESSELDSSNVLDEARTYCILWWGRKYFLFSENGCVTKSQIKYLTTSLKNLT